MQIQSYIVLWESEMTLNKLTWLKYRTYELLHK